jgi:hypothetical protein
MTDLSTIVSDMRWLLWLSHMSEAGSGSRLRLFGHLSQNTPIVCGAVFRTVSAVSGGLLQTNSTWFIQIERKPDAFALERQVLYHCSHAHGPFCFSYFSGRVSNFLPRTDLDYDPFTYVSQVVGITGMHHHAWLVCGEGAARTFFARTGLQHFCS